MNDPKRLLDDANDPDLERLLASGKSDLPDAAQLSALAAKIGLLGGGAAGAAGASGGAGGSAGATAVKSALALKLGTAVVVAGVAAGSASLLVSAREDPPQAPVGIVAAASPSATALAQGIAIRSAPDSAPEDRSADPAAPPLSVIRPDATPRKTSLPGESGPEAEVRLLERAQDALRTRPATALALADEHARRFPDGMLVQEREVIAVEALMKIGRADAARTRAQRFMSRFPTSTHARRVEALVAE